MSQTLKPKEEKELIEAYRDHQMRQSQLRNFDRVLKSSRPKYQFETRPGDKSKRHAKTLTSHPTKRVARSRKSLIMEQAIDGYVNRARTAEERYNKIMDKVVKRAVKKGTPLPKNPAALPIGEAVS